MYDMQCNLISITPVTWCRVPHLAESTHQLNAWGYRVHTTPMQETAKMEGLLRCVTMPLQRQA